MKPKRRHGKPSAVTLQFSIEYAIPKKGWKMTAAVLNEAVQYWIQEGESPPGMEVKAVAFIHGSKVTEAHSEDEFRVLLGRLVQGGGAIHFKIRSHERV